MPHSACIEYLVNGKQNLSPEEMYQQELAKQIRKWRDTLSNPDADYHNIKLLHKICRASALQEVEKVHPLWVTLNKREILNPD